MQELSKQAMKRLSEEALELTKGKIKREIFPIVQSTDWDLLALKTVAIVEIEQLSYLIRVNEAKKEK